MKDEKKTCCRDCANYIRPHVYDKKPIKLFGGFLTPGKCSAARNAFMSDGKVLIPSHMLTCDYFEAR